ncbi:MAG: class I SAM-dependent methyltransferase [Sphingomonadaceae bacterium]|nr:class I SAM-dependent methyltransferase [Sphingomonadaceae bacterium]
MSDLLIHSMAEFAPLILKCLARAKARQVVEIGAEFGGMSQCLADYCLETGGQLTSIDPAPKQEFLDWVQANPHVRHIAQPSLDVMAGLSGVDAWVIDGDHNYYTVMNELRHAHALARGEDRPLLVFLHDISWPCGRRDFYYAPERIPEEFRLPHSFDAGVTLDNAGCQNDRGMRGMGQFAVALEEGGPRNGVLTAIEDFISVADSEGQPLVFAHIPAVFGLGVLFDGSADWAEDVAGFLLPYHENDLIASLELNRLRNYLAVIDWQDREADRLSDAA